MSIALFEKILKQIKPLTKRVALHLRGDPLSVDNLKNYIEVAIFCNIKLEITTNSHYLKSSLFDTLLSSSVAQINFSLQSILANKNIRKQDIELKTILDFCDYALKFNNRPYINLRLWAMDDSSVTRLLFDHFNAFDEKLAPKIRLTKAPMFEWPDLHLPIYKDCYCHAPFDQFGILSNGTVVPCCLDKDGIVNLGNVNENSIVEILNSKRALNLKNGFALNKAVEELCKHCSYRLRFEK